jgi:hypothetical protein
LATIDLDDQLCRMTDEVGYEPAYRRLTAKPVPFGLPQSQHLPEPYLGFGHLAAECAGALVSAFARLFLHRFCVLAASPPPWPSPIKGRVDLLVHHASRNGADFRR